MVVVARSAASGVVDYPAGTLQALINVAPAGGTLVPPVGRYHEAISVPIPGLTIDMTGSEIDADNTRADWVTISADDVTILGGTYRDAVLSTSQVSGFRIFGRQRFTGRNMRMTVGPASILGMQNGADHKFYDCEFDHGPESLFTINRVDRFEFHNCRFHDALGTMPGFNAGNEGGAGKYGGYVGESPTPENPPGQTGALFVDCEVYNIVGAGLWGDVRPINSTFQRCRVHDVDRMGGIFFEVGDTALIEDCVVYRVGRTESAWGYGAGITNSSSRYVTVRGCTLYDCARGITALSQTRKAANGYDYNPGMTGMQFYNNNVIAKNASDVYLIGFFRDWADPLFYDGTNRAYGNYFWHPAAEPQNGRFYRSRTTGQYIGDYATLAEFMALFGDTTSRYLSTAEKDAILLAQGIAP